MFLNALAGLVLIFISVAIVFLPTMSKWFNKASVNWGPVELFVLLLVFFVSICGIATGILLMTGMFTVLFVD